MTNDVAGHSAGCAGLSAEHPVTAVKKSSRRHTLLPSLSPGAPAAAAGPAQPGAQSWSPSPHAPHALRVQKQMRKQAEALTHQWVMAMYAAGLGAILSSLHNDSSVCPAKPSTARPTGQCMQTDCRCNCLQCSLHLPSSMAATHSLTLFTKLPAKCSMSARRCSLSSLAGSGSDSKPREVQGRQRQQQHISQDFIQGTF